MLQLIYGGAATGKTYTVMQKIKADVQNKQPAVLLVPEQFSFESERAVLELLGDKLALGVEVISFTGLADSLHKQCGGNKEILSDCDKINFMVKTLKGLKDTLPVWQNFLSSFKFASKVVDLIGEFKVNALTYEDIANAALSLPQGALKTKLTALELVWRSYDSLIESKFIDPADKLTVLYRNLLNYNYFGGKNVYIDSFKGFTGQQKQIIEHIISRACNTTVTALCDNLNGEELNIFYNIRKTLNQIVQFAKKHGVKISPDIVLNTPYYESNEMQAIEKNLRVAPFEFENNGNLCVCRAQSSTDEASFAALYIKKLVREKGLRYKDFALIAKNTEEYDAAVESEFTKTGVPCFFDKRIGFNLTPVYRLVSSAIKAADSYKAEDILTFLKTGLANCLNKDQISVLENYILLWNINGSAFNKEWEMDPAGFIAKEQDEIIADKELLDEINYLRKCAIAPINKLRKRLSGSVKNMAEAIYLLLKDIGTDSLMKNFIQTLPKDISPEDADAFRQSYGKLMEILDGLVRCFGDEELTVEEFVNAFDISAATTTVGRIPQLLDQVTFAAAERICPSNFKYIVILGANQGVFPAVSENNSLLCNNDRKRLNKAGLLLKDKTIEQSIDESLLVYSLVCAASQGVCVCYNALSEPSGFVTSLLKFALNTKEIEYPAVEPCNDFLPESIRTGFDLLCRSEKDTPFTSSLAECVLSDNQYKLKYERSVKCIADSDFSLQSETAKALYSHNIHGSATRFDTFHRCHFQYFCRYGLKAEKIMPASLDVMQRGTLVHFVLEQFCNRHLENIGTVSENVIKAETEEFTNLYLSLIKGSQSLMTPRFIFLLRKIKEGIRDVLKRIVDEFAQSKFKPECCEVSIKPGGVIEPVEFSFKDGKFYLYGSIDRLDTFGSYVRIVDYKTGSKKFNISDTLYGQNMQMLLYLYAVVRGSNQNYNSKKPAGILYLPSKADIEKQGLAMNGLLCDDISVIKAMEENLSGEFIPEFKLKKDGTASKTNTSFISVEDFETIFDYIELLAKKMGSSLLGGDISVDPIDAKGVSACQYCDYKAVCGIEDKEHKFVENLKNNEVLFRMRGETGEI